MTILKKHRTEAHCQISRLIIELKQLSFMWYWYKERQIDHWNKIDSGETDSPIYSHTIYDKIDNGQKGLFSKWSWII